MLADLRVHHTGGPYYGAISAEKSEFWAALLEEAGAAGRDQAARVPGPVLRPPQRALQLVRRPLHQRAPSRDPSDVDDVAYVREQEVNDAERFVDERETSAVPR